jgi:hypothetical protein
VDEKTPIDWFIWMDDKVRALSRPVSEDGEDGTTVLLLLVLCVRLQCISDAAIG